MKAFWKITLALGAAAVLCGQVIAPIPLPQEPPTKTFTPLHLYFLAPAGSGGSDANDGLAPTVGGGHGPWLTPNHSVVCGDVILAATGNYTGSTFNSTLPTPSNCPSTTGGIDGTGGIWFAIVLCAGSDIGTTNGCNIPGTGNTNGFSSVQYEEGQNNWAFSGFYFNSGCTIGSPTNCSRAFGSRNCNNGTSTHHMALINSVIVNSQQGFAGNDCGGQGGVADRYQDYIAAVGLITQDAAKNGDFQSNICIGSIDFTNLGNHDTTAGTHAYMYNNYGIKNQSPACVSQYDGHAFYIDSPEAHLFNQQAVIANNIGYLSTRTCIALTFSNQNPVPANDTGTYKIYNNTCFNDVVLGASAGEGSGGDQGEMNLNTGSNNTTVTISVTKNIAYNSNATNSGGGGINVKPYAVDVWFAIPSGITWGGTGNENIFKGSATSCNFNCDTPNFNIEFNSQSVPSGTNFLGTNPSFTDTADLLANQTGPPSCNGFDNTTKCMGWDATTKTLTTPSVIGDLTATCGNCTGKGFQRPSIQCAANPDYPVWLKGLNYLHALDGFVANSRIQERSGLATKPCGM